MLKIDLGCGDDCKEGFEGLDIRPLPGVKYVSDVRTLPFQNNTVDQLVACHVIEHFTIHEIPEILKEWYRVLKFGGSLTVWCPNLRYIATEYLRLDSTENEERKYDLLGWLYGEQNYEANYHYFCYDQPLLVRVLEKAGLKVESLFGPTQQNLCMRGMK